MGNFHIYDHIGTLKDVQMCGYYVTLNFVHVYIYEPYVIRITRFEITSDDKQCIQFISKTAV